jgi:sugar/nucleoside kinase (ribokinase family)
MPPPDVLAIGNVSCDLVPGGWRPGGTVTFAAAQAHALGLSVGIVTRAAADFAIEDALPFALIARKASAATTTFENEYTAEGRRQKVRAEADPLAVEDIPADWRASPVVLIGPVFGEAPAELAATFDRRSLVGVSAQGWLRARDAGDNVVRAPWEGPPFWLGAEVLFVSDEDLADAPHQLDAWTRDVPVVAMTESRKGARIWSEGRWRRMDAFPQDEVDPTGAGDTFATAFLIRLHETGDVAEAARFGAAAASISVGGVALAAIAGREQIEARMAEHPEVALR